MKNLFVPYELALISKEKGFKEPCCNYWFTGNTGTNEDNYVCESIKVAKNWNQEGLCVSSPLYQQVIDWLRDEKGIFIRITRCIPESFIFNFMPHKEEMKNISMQFSRRSYNTYYECLTKAIEEALELIK